MSDAIHDAPQSPDSGAKSYEAWAAESLRRWLPESAPNFASTLAWVVGRFAEGREVARTIRAALPGPTLAVLDLGSGNGGVSLGLCDEPTLSVTACDSYLNGEVIELRAATDRSFHHTVGRGERLPFRDAAFDAVVLLDVVEHVAAARDLGREVARVLRPGGLAVITTPPRWRFLLSGDPHHGIRGLALLPAPLQRLVAERWLRRTARYDVAHLYWTARGVAAILPRGAFTVRTEGGAPRRRRLGIDWDRILCTKRETGDGGTTISGAGRRGSSAPAVPPPDPGCG